MIKKTVFITVILISCVFEVWAAKIGLEKAKLTGRNFISEKIYSLEGRIEHRTISETFVYTLNGSEVYYAFNLKPSGFVIVSAEDIYYPVIGFNTTGSFIHENMDPNFASFLDGYVEQIQWIRSTGIQPDEDVSALWQHYENLDPAKLTKRSGDNISPLLTSLWNQDYPYNMLCPVNSSGPGGHVYAGCVATAMSMVMHYWRYPQQGTGQHSYNYPPYGNISANFGATQYKYYEMKDVMDPEYEAVALLQFHCGVAVNMMYGANGSGAYSEDVPGAIQDHFGYSTNSAFYDKNSYSLPQWTAMIKEQLDLKQPMYYSGCSNSGCHAFVCDGYSDNDYFHFNFGWSGTNNGYYTLYEVGGFNSWQGAVMDFIPAENYPFGCQGQQVLTAKTGSVEDGSGPVANYEEGADCSWLIDPQQPGDSISGIILHFIKFDMGPEDFVTVYDGGTSTASILGQFTGSTIPADLTSTGNQLLITLKNNGGITGNGFYASYSSLKPEWCHGLTTLTEPAGILNDGSAQFNYYDHTVCMWKVIPESNGQPITFWFNSFDTESDNDVVRIYDLQTQALLASYSGTYTNGNMPDPVVIPSGKMFVTFSTNGSLNGQGWEGEYITGTVGMDDQETITENIRIYPNPATQMVNIIIPFAAELSIKAGLFTISGQEVHSEMIYPSTLKGSFDVAGYPKGIYYLKLSTDSWHHTEKLVIR